MISSIDHLLEFKKLTSLNELIIEDNPVLFIKEVQEILKTLPIKIKEIIFPEISERKNSEKFQSNSSKSVALPEILDTNMNIIVNDDNKKY